MRIWNVPTIAGKGLPLALLCSLPFLLFSHTAVDASSSSTTTTLSAYGNCPPPPKAGVNVCSPPFVTDTDAPFQVIASATSGRGQITEMELWADGKFVTRSAGTPFDEPITLSAGNESTPATHELTIIARDTTGQSVKSAPFEVPVVGVTEPQDADCSLPTEPGVNVCQPVSNSCELNGWDTVAAAGKARTGTVIRMELWVNGVKIANFPGDRINTNMILNDFDSVKIFEVDSNSGYLASEPVVIQIC
jgi:hypothetical protein